MAGDSVAILSAFDFFTSSQCTGTATRATLIGTADFSQCVQVSMHINGVTQISYSKYVCTSDGGAIEKSSATLSECQSGGSSSFTYTAAGYTALTTGNCVSVSGSGSAFNSVRVVQGSSVQFPTCTPQVSASAFDFYTATNCAGSGIRATLIGVADFSKCVQVSLATNKGVVVSYSRYECKADGGAIEKSASTLSACQSGGTSTVDYTPAGYTALTSGSCVAFSGLTSSFSSVQKVAGSVIKFPTCTPSVTSGATRNFARFALLLVFSVATSLYWSLFCNMKQ